MFYEPDQPHGLPRNPFKACVTPRPIGWISTQSPEGIPNLAPFSQFNNLSFDPPFVMIAANQTFRGDRKDTTYNIEKTGNFVWNMATYDLRDAVNISGRHFAPDVDEFAEAGVTVEMGSLIECPMVKESPVKFECTYHSTFRIPGAPPMGATDILIGKVVGVHIDERVMTDGFLDLMKARPIARLGYMDYTVVDNMFSMTIPGGKEENLGLCADTTSNTEMLSKYKKKEEGEEKVERAAAVSKGH